MVPHESCLVRVVGLIAGLALALVSVVCAAQDVQTPQLSFASVDWPGAIAALPIADPPPVAPMSAKSRLGANRAAAPALARINSIMSQQFAGIATSPVPVLVPFDVAALLRDHDAGAEPDAEQYYSGFHAARFFYPGPAGYDAAFAIRTGDIPELADSKFADPIEVQISGSALLYDLAAPIAGRRPAGAGARRGVSRHPQDDPRALPALHVRALRRTLCGVDRLLRCQRRRATRCRPAAPPIRSRSASCARCVSPAACRATCAPARPLPVERPARVSHSFGYYGPGQLAVRHRLPQPARPGRLHGLFADPLSARGCAGLCQLRKCISAAAAPASDADDAGAAIAWRDNFCERRGFPVSQCPAGIGHQGQDIRPGTVQAAARRGALHPPRRHRRGARRRDPALAAAGGGLSVRQLRQRAHPLPLPAHEPDEDGRRQSAQRPPRPRGRGHRRGLELQHEGGRHQLSRAFRCAGADPIRLGVRQSLHDAGRRLRAADRRARHRACRSDRGRHRRSGQHRLRASSSRLEPDRPRPSRRVKQERGKHQLARAHKMQDKRRRQHFARG